MRFIPLVLGVALFLPSALAPPVSAQPRGGSRVVLFEDVDFHGPQLVVDREVRDFRDIGFNDRASGIRVESGTWEFCEDADFRGRCITPSRDDHNLVPEGFNDKISSARPVADRDQRGDNRGNDRGRGGDVTLYADINFGAPAGTRARAAICATWISTIPYPVSAFAPAPGNSARMPISRAAA